MTTFKHADKVTCTIIDGCETHDITDAKISIDNDGTPFICHNNPDCKGYRANDTLGYLYGWKLNNDFTRSHVTNLKLAVRSVRDAVAGDIVANGTYTRMVIDSFPNSVLLSYDNDHRKAGGLYSHDELERNFTFQRDTPTPPPEEMTLAEVCEALGSDIIIKG